MKKLIVVFFLLAAVNASALDTITGKYFPLQVGNVYKYHYAASSGFNFNYKVRIVKDTIINSKRYFIVSQAFPGYIGGPIRVDSISGNIYRRSSGYCSYSPFEELIDSLRARKNDTTLVCISTIPKHICIDTGYVNLFGNYYGRKIFLRNSSSSSTSISYVWNFGITFASHSDMYGIASENLVGCYINGVLYGDTIMTNLQNISIEIPSSYSLSQNYPNPFNPVTKIKFDVASSPLVPLQRGIDVKIIVYDVMGREIQTLVNERLQPGTYEVTFDGSMLNSGVYFYKLITDGFTETKRMLMIK